MPVSVIFDKEKLEEAVILLRRMANMDGPSPSTTSAQEKICEVLKLDELLRSRGETRKLFDVHGFAMATERANETESRVVLQVTDFVREYLSARERGALDRKGLSTV